MKITKNLAKVISKILKFLQRRLVMVVLPIIARKRLVLTQEER